MDTLRSNRRSRRSGSALVVTLLVLLSLTVLGTATVYFAGQQSEVAAAARFGDQSLFFADAGIQWGLGWVDQNGLAAAAAGHDETVTLLNGAGDTVYVAKGGGREAVTVDVSIGSSPDSRGRQVACGLPGFSEKYGSPRFRVTATGRGVGMRAIEAHVLLPPQPGLCPPGQNVTGGYAGSI